MGNYGVLDDCKAKTGATELATAPLVDPIEALEKVFQMLWLYTRAIVAHGELVVLVVRWLSGDFNESSPCGVCDDVVDEVAEDTVYEAGITGDNNLLGHRQAWCDAFLLECESCVIEDAASNLRNVYFLAFFAKLEVAGIHFV